MTKESLAELLNGRQYRSEISDNESKQAARAGLVIVFGASDDLLEFRGAIDEEVGVFEGDTYQVFKKNKAWSVLPEYDFMEQKEKAHEFDVDLRGYEIEAIWWPDEPECSWLIKTEIPHTTFDIMEDGELYCRGIVFSIDDLK